MSRSAAGLALALMMCTRAARAEQQDAAASAPPNDTAAPSPEPERWRWKADFRLRGELVAYEQDVPPGDMETPTRLRGRFRVRAGVERQVTDTLVLGARLATGSGKPTSGNVSFGDFFGRKAVGLDRAYLDYRALPWLRFVGGKIANPFFDRELLWDGDVSPEGLAETAAVELGDVKLAATAAQLMLEDLDETSSDPWLFAGELVATFGLGAVELAAAVGYHHYINLDSAPLPYGEGTNTQDAMGTLTGRYHILVALLAMTWRTPFVPIATHVQVSKNLAFDDGDLGAQLEVRVGVNRAAGNLSAGYIFQRLERDATLDALAESHWHSQATNYVGHAVNAKLNLATQWLLSSSLKLMKAIEGPRDDEYRWTLDAIVVL